jgi:Heavy-metal resistance
MKPKHLILAGLILSLAVVVWSAPPGGQREETQPRARLRERISDLYLLRLTRALDLTEEQAAKVYPLLTKAEKVKSGLQSRMGLDLRDLRRELAGSPVEERKVLELVAGIRGARQAIRQTEDNVEAALEGILTPVQRARYLIFTVDFLRSVGENLDRARAGRGLTKRSP